MRDNVERPALGYRGPRRVIEEIDILEPNSVQHYFHQRRREGRRRSPEYRVVERMEVDKGPEPIPVPVPEKKPDPEPTAPVEDIEFVEPIVPTHRDVAFSDEFVILEIIEPDYPHYEEMRRVEGFVIVRLWAMPNGDVEREEIIRAGTIPPGGTTTAFELSVLEAVKKWRVLPPQSRPDGDWIELRYDFELPGIR